MLYHTFYMIILSLLIYPTEAKLSGRVDYVGIEFAVQQSSFIVVAKPKTSPKTELIKFADDSSYSWTVQDFEVIEVLKQPFETNTLTPVISVSSFDGYAFEIAKKYAEGVRRIGWYKIYESNNQGLVEENGERVIFLNRWQDNENTEKLTYVYSISNAFDAIESIDTIRQVITTENN